MSITTTFHHFPWLAYELRMQIWMYAFDNLPITRQPKCISLNKFVYNHKQNTYPTLSKTCPLNQLFHHLPRHSDQGSLLQPELSLACPESRSVYIKYICTTQTVLFYEKESSSNMSDIKSTRYVPVTANLDQDILLFPRDVSVNQILALAKIMGPFVCGKILHFGRHAADVLPIFKKRKRVWPAMCHAFPNSQTQTAIVDLDTIAGEESEANEVSMVMDFRSDLFISRRKDDLTGNGAAVHKGKEFVPNEETIILRTWRVKKDDFSLEDNGFVLV